MVLKLSLSELVNLPESFMDTKEQFTIPIQEIYATPHILTDAIRQGHFAAMIIASVLANYEGAKPTMKVPEFTDALLCIATQSDSINLRVGALDTLAQMIPFMANSFHLTDIFVSLIMEESSEYIRKKAALALARISKDHFARMFDKVIPAIEITFGRNSRTCSTGHMMLVLKTLSLDETNCRQILDRPGFVDMMLCAPASSYEVSLNKDVYKTLAFISHHESCQKKMANHPQLVECAIQCADSNPRSTLLPMTILFNLSHLPEMKSFAIRMEPMLRRLIAEIDEIEDGDSDDEFYLTRDAEIVHTLAFFTLVNLGLRKGCESSEIAVRIMTLVMRTGNCGRAFEYDHWNMKNAFNALMNISDYTNDEEIALRRDMQRLRVRSIEMEAAN